MKPMEDQTAAAQCLWEAAGGDAAERVETHVSVLFIGPERVFKMKRAVRFPYLDFTTLEARRRACEAELAINRRTAPELYRGVVAVCRDGAGALVLDGAGAPVEWAVEMQPFDQDTLYDRQLQAGLLRRRQMEELADAIGGFHAAAQVCPEADGASGISMIVENNRQAFAEAPATFLEPTKIDTLNEASRLAADRLSPILEARRDGGQVRQCHGDLHLRNICRFGGRPTLFDAIEFDPAFSEIDILYDLAFLLMDLHHRDARRLANIAFNRYFDATGAGRNAPGAHAVLPLFLSMRAAIRSHVDASQANLPLAPVEQGAWGAEAAAYLDLALAYLQPAGPRLIAVGGLSGSGKSRLARELAPLVPSPLGARVARTDAVRKGLAGAALTDTLGKEGYTAEMHMKTYDAFYAELAGAVADGCPAIADGVFASEEQRDRVEEIARKAGVPFTGIWVHAPVEVRAERAAARQHNISDATPEIVRQQEDYDLGEIRWHRVDSTGPREDTVAAGRAVAGV